MVLNLLRYTLLGCHARQVAILFKTELAYVNCVGITPYNGVIR